MIKLQEKGIVLMIVLCTFFIVILLANVILSLISSQSRLTHHKVSRIQAYYAAMAGINLAYENLRAGTWALPAAGTSNTWTMCSGCVGAGFINEPAFPGSINNVEIRVAGSGYVYPSGNICSPPAGVPICITATSDYAYL